jgi:aryl-phospho-beta-D-glucosidase BglC (GH1 family)
MIDLHGAPLSQNGFDNSGHRTDSPQWQQGDSVAQTLAVLKTISMKYAASEYQDVVSSIELLNEPLGSKLNYDGIKDFYKKGYEQVRQTSDTPVIFHDAFNAPSSWNGFLSTSDNGAYNGKSSQTSSFLCFSLLTLSSRRRPSRIPSLLLRHHQAATLGTPTTRLQQRRLLLLGLRQMGVRRRMDSRHD